MLFCTFVECWLEFFLRSLMVSRTLPKEIMDRMLDDNWRLDDRTGKLFKTLTDKAFGDVLSDLTDANKRKRGYLNYQDVWSFVKELKKLRNDLMHKGAIYSLSEEVAEKCIHNIQGVNGLFISLHNQFVARPADGRWQIKLGLCSGAG